MLERTNNHIILLFLYVCSLPFGCVLCDVAAHTSDFHPDMALPNQPVTHILTRRSIQNDFSNNENDKQTKYRTSAHPHTHHRRIKWNKKTEWNGERKKSVDREKKTHGRTEISQWKRGTRKWRARVCVCESRMLCAVCCVQYYYIIYVLQWHSHTAIRNAHDIPYLYLWSLTWCCCCCLVFFFFFHSVQPSVYIFHFIPVCSHHPHFVQLSTCSVCYLHEHVAWLRLYFFVVAAAAAAFVVVVVGNSQTT